MSDWKRARRAFTIHWLSRAEKSVIADLWDRALREFLMALRLYRPQPLLRRESLPSSSSLSLSSRYDT